MAEMKTNRTLHMAGVLTVPAIVVSLLPALACPLCWPGYAALLSSAGLGFLASSAYLLPLTAALLAVALASLAIQARRRGGYAIVALGLIASAVILAGKFIVGLSAIAYGGVALLAGASIWAVLPGRAATSGACSTCGSPSAAGPQAV